jgi:polyhydroxybutyrate depolymerase
VSRIGVTLGIALALAGCASAGALRAEDGELRTIRVAGVERSYVLHLPPTGSSGGPLALVLVLHGAGGNARVIEQQTGFSDEADWRGFAVAYPNGTADEGAEAPSPGRPRLRVWNAGHCCGIASEREIDDVGFLRALVEEIARELPIDRRRVYAAGLSNGGMMAYRLACEASDSFAAVGVVSGALVTPCAPSEPVSVIHFHGTGDHIVPILGGPGWPFRRGFSYPPAETALELWREADGCSGAPQNASPSPGVDLRRYAACTAGTGIDYYVLEGGKHAWPGGDGRSSLLWPIAKPLAATPVIWEFFASHPKPEP